MDQTSPSSLPRISQGRPVRIQLKLALWRFMPTNRNDLMMPEFLPFPIQKKNSLAWWMHEEESLGSLGPFSKATWFQCFHRDQRAKGNKYLHEIPLADMKSLARQLVFNNSERSSCRKFPTAWGVPIFLQKSLAKGQSLNRCRIDSSWV